MMKKIELQTPESTKLVEVIEVVSKRGNGESTPIRKVVQYWSKEGKLLGEIAPL